MASGAKVGWKTTKRNVWRNSFYTGKQMKKKMTEDDLMIREKTLDLMDYLNELTKDEKQEEAISIIENGFDGGKEENLQPVLECLNACQPGRRVDSRWYRRARYHGFARGCPRKLRQADRWCIVCNVPGRWARGICQDWALAVSSRPRISRDA